VYPLFYQNQYIGSVEVSFDTNSFKDALNNNLHNAQFIISKEIVDKKVWSDEHQSNYTSTNISSDFLIEKNSNTHLEKIEESITPELRQTFSKNISSVKAYSIALEIGKETSVLSFLPIKNPINDNVVAYMITISKSKHFDNLNLEYRILQITALALILSIFIIIYRNTLHQNRLITDRMEILKQQKLLAEQSKMAQMGSMLSNVAHQWKQPLAQINSKLIEMPLYLNLNAKDKNSLENSIEDIEELTSYMATTLEDFISYFHPNKKKTNFTIRQTIDKAISFSHIKNSFENLQIQIKCSNKTKVLSYENELMQVLIILLINAKEAFEDKGVKNPVIKVVSTEDENIVTITIVDNAGGIEDNLQDKIFNPYFSTKNKNGNSGIGLYMAKMIIEGSMRGKLEYSKVNNESRFKISIKNTQDE
jgi:signal transduction histidine kinase